MDIWWSQSPAAVAGAFALAVGMYFVVVLAFRAGKRRTVAELAPFDLAAVIAVGAITGRTATGGNSVAVGLVAVAGLLVAHWLVSRLRRVPALRSIIDHPTAILVLDGKVQMEGLRRAGLTLTDLEAALRNQRVSDVRDVAIAVFETRHGVSVLVGATDAPLWQPVVGTEDRSTSS
jgi:uncharacterized membrane protein YcaP (DUF421 family)